MFQANLTCKNSKMSNEKKAIDGNEEQTSSELLDTGHSQDSLGPRQRILTEKGKEERLNWLKQQRVNALRAVSRKRTEVSEFMVDINNLHLVKNELINLNDLIEQYKDAFHAYHEELTDGGDKDREHARHDEKIKDIMAYLHPVYAWVSQAEGRLADQLERASSKGSKASKASSRLSARDRERVRLAELKAERSMLKQKQALRAAEEDLELQLEIVKAEAREKALNEIDREQEVPPPSCSSGPPSVVASFSPIVVSSVPTSLPNVLAFSPKALDSTAHNPAFAETQEKSTLQGTRNTGATDAATESSLPNPKVTKFIPGTFENGISSTPTGHGPETPEQISHGVSEVQSPRLAERTFQSVIELQQKQNETIIATHQQLTAAMTLPQPTITKFKGDPIGYKTFVMAFDARIRSKATNSADLLYYLNQHLEGEPADLIQGCLHMNPDEGYVEARRLLQKEYGDPFKISTAYLNKILRWAPIRFDDNQGLKRLSIFLTKCTVAMKNISYMRVLDHAPNMQAIVSKLPANLQAKWRDHVFKKKKRESSLICFADLAEFVEYASESANDPVFGKEALNKTKEDVKPPKVKEPPNQVKTPPKSSGNQWKYKESSFATSSSGAIKPPFSDGAGSPSNHGNPSCLFCSHAHDLDDCELFSKKTPELKRAFLREKNMCFGCYGTNHLSRNCLNRRKCKHCGKSHPSALHIDGFQLPQKDNNSSVKQGKERPMSNACTNPQETSCHATRHAEAVLHAILPVRVRKKGSTESVITYAFYDNGSGGCFLTENLKQQIGVDGERTELQLGTMHGQSLVTTTVVNDLVVTDLEDKNPIEIPRSYTRMEIPVTEQQIPTPEVVKQWEHLRGVAERMPEFIPNLEVGLLIGSNCPAAMEPLEVVPSGDKGPYAMRLRHGWTLTGPLPVKDSPIPDNVTCHRITVREVESIKEVVSPQAIQQMFELDFNDHKYGPDEYGYSQEDKKFIREVKQGIRHQDGYYVIPLPFREPQLTMPNNRDQALKRANWQRKKMLHDENYRNDYVNFVNEMIARGYARKVPEDRLEANPGKVWYIPHHGIYHPRKPHKIRVVFDCSAKHKGTSLNDQLLQGPDLTNSLVGVLTRFRQDRVAFMADIEAMFHQVRVPDEQCDFLRFLWWPDGNLEAAIQEYQMTVHLFGAASSPSCCNFALKQTAEDTEPQRGSLVAETIRRNFYVDDCLRSVKDEQTAIELIQGLHQACTHGGFNLTKFISNSRAVLESVPTEKRSKEAKDLDLGHDRLPVERALGVQWCVESDVFEFRIIVNCKPPTRRGILSVISSVYDPLGFAAPFTLPAKKILQDLCREEIGWDDTVPDQYQIKWAKWLSELPLLEQFKVSRCVIPAEFGTVMSRQIHVFSDASSIGYGTVAYLRLQDDSNRIHCTFLIGKARLAPIKPVTIPRLELTAATVSIRVGELLKKEIDGNPEFMYHTDSTTVLRYIANEQQRFHVFVANRVQLIRDHSCLNQWKYVDTKENPADDASRGLDGLALVGGRRWLKGPAFLWKPESEWPHQPFTASQVPEDDPEVKRTTTSSAVIINQSADATSKLINYFSNWYQLKRAVAVFLRVKNILQTRRNDRLKVKDEVSSDGKNLTDQRSSSTIKMLKPKGIERPRLPLTVQDLVKAELAILKFAQSSAFSKEIHVLRETENEMNLDRKKLRGQKKAFVKNNSPIHRLDPFLEEGILRVGGRLKRADLPHETKHPAILPQKSHVTTLLIRHAHKRLGHAGRGHVIATLREKYWIVKMNAAVRHVISKCVFCRRNHSKPSEQKMADLPKNRISPAPPFTYTGVDYFGPFIIKEGRREVKRYGALFTCLVSRAVHIEVASTLESSSFIQALRRFIARRGPVREIRSDNGTNFIGARNELLQAIEEMDHEEIRAKLREENIDWLFNPPAASHMGGVWERQIKTTRKILAGLMEEYGHSLNEESFQTLMCEVEAIINSRPLTTVSGEPDDLEPLTPNHILTTKSTVILPPPGQFQKNDVYMRRRWRRVQYLANLFWSRWKKEYLVVMQERSKWQHPQRNLVEGDIVILREENVPRNAWSLAVVVQAEPDGQGLVRSAVVKTQSTTLRRPINKLVLILPKEEQERNQEK